MVGGGLGQSVDFPGGVLPFPSSVTGTLALQVGPHGDDEVAALKDQVIAQVEAEKINNDPSAPAPVAACTARCRENAMEADQVLRLHIACTDGIHEEGPLRTIQPAYAVAIRSAVATDWEEVLLVVLIAGLARHQIVEMVVGKPRVAAGQFVASIELVSKRRAFLWPTLDGSLGPEMLDIVLSTPTPIRSILVTGAPLRPRHRALAVPALEVLDSGEYVLDVAPSRLLSTLRLGKPVRLLRSYLSSQLAAADPIADHRPEARSTRRLTVIGTCRTRTEGGHLHEPGRGAGLAARHGP